MSTSIESLGKKVSYAAIPNIITTSILLGLNEYFKTSFSLNDIVVYNSLVGLGYIIVWHESRLAMLEKKELLQ